MLERYEDMTRGMNDPNLSACRSELRYKYDALIFNVMTDEYRAASSSSSTVAASKARAAAFQTNMPPVLRRLILYEIDHGFDYDAQNFAFLVNMHFLQDLHTPATSQQLGRITDKQLVEVLRATFLNTTGTPTNQPGSNKAALRLCQHCRATEAMLGDFKACSRCKAVHYCSKDCQTSDWKAGHKKACIPK